MSYVAIPTQSKRQWYRTVCVSEPPVTKYDMPLQYQQHKHCSLIGVYLAYTALLPEILISAPHAY